MITSSFVPLLPIVPAIFVSNSNKALLLPSAEKSITLPELFKAG